MFSFQRHLVKFYLKSQNQHCSKKAIKIHREVLGSSNSLIWKCCYLTIKTFEFGNIAPTLFPPTFGGTMKLSLSLFRRIYPISHKKPHRLSIRRIILSIRRLFSYMHLVPCNLHRYTFTCFNVLRCTRGHGKVRGKMTYKELVEGGGLVV